MVINEPRKINDLDVPETDPTLTRRRFLKWGIYAIAGGITATLAVPSIGYFIAPTLSGSSKVLAAVGKMTDFTNTYNQSPKSVSITHEYLDGFKSLVAKATVFVEALKPDAALPADFQVLSNICTHLGCSLTFDELSKKFGPCVCHGSIFDHNGNALRGPAVKRLHKYEVTIEAGILKIDPLQDPMS